MGGNTNCGCHKCQWGGPHEYTESDHGYHSAHYVSEILILDSSVFNAKADVLLKLALLKVLRRSRILWRNSYGRQCLGSTSMLKRCKWPLEPKIRSHNTGLNSYSRRQSQCKMTIPILHQKRLQMICKNGWMSSQWIK